MEFLAILSGISLVVLALLPNGGLTPGRKVGVIGLGVLFAGYGFYVAAQDSGTWRFPIIVFALPVIAAVEVVREIRDHRRRTAQWAPAQGAPMPSAPTLNAPGPGGAELAAFCTACGSRLRPEVRFCTRCGARRAVVPAPAAVGRPAWLLPVAIGGGAVALVVTIVVLVTMLGNRGPGVDEQEDVAGALVAAARESACADAASDGLYLASEMARVIPDDFWVDSPAYPTVVEAPFAELARTCGYEYGSEALNAVGIVGVTYRAIDGAMLAAAPPVVAEPAPQDQGGVKQSTQSDEPLVVPGSVTLWGGGAIGDLGYFAPADYALTTLANELGAWESEGDVSCSDGAITGRQYWWDDFLVFVGEQGFTYDHPSGEVVTVEAPYVGGWMLVPGDGARTGLRTADGLGTGDSVDELLTRYPGAYVAGPGPDGTVDWEFFAGDMGGYVFTTTGEEPDDVVVAIRSGTVCW
ncbi:zinc ribbon domain-containing protein [Actinotalea fermentans]|uniref:Zinc-ribbon domain-containing protein n=1 Tax=Actinotalea fermentans TaxID=43671 RepID=A0A511YZE7_9CELL|nr:zinc ribbon domain-containing protein [Actinotalea fermentans]GEN80506.1 hypothetical protein AFE02nite_22400 [Actinotalea fermentans]